MPHGYSRTLTPVPAQATTATSHCVRISGPWKAEIYAGYTSTLAFSLDQFAIDELSWHLRHGRLWTLGVLWLNLHPGQPRAINTPPSIRPESVPDHIHLPFRHLSGRHLLLGLGSESASSFDQHRNYLAAASWEYTSR